MKQIEVIKERLKELKDLDKGFSVFGSSRHRYQWNRTLKDEEIKLIEQENQIILSNDYKDILKHLGNGGAGCGYGLEKLDLKHINPPYIGSKKLLRNWDKPKDIDCEMVDLDEISGYIKLFDYGCGMEYCLIVKGLEVGSLIFFDCDERFEKIEGKSLLDTYENWLDYHLGILKRVQQKLGKLPLQKLIDSEWKLKNYSIHGMVLSIIDAEPTQGAQSGKAMKAHLEKEYEKWKNKAAL